MAGSVSGIIDLPIMGENVGFASGGGAFAPALALGKAG